MRWIVTFLLLLSFCLKQKSYGSLYNDLQIIHSIDQENSLKLPLIYDHSQMIGYINMPSAKMAQTGVVALGIANVPPYLLYNLNVQPFFFIELAGSYRVFKGKPEENFGHMGFGDDADRTGNVKFALQPSYFGYHYLPSIGVGVEDFIGSKRFHSRYIALTQELTNLGIEATLGYSKGRQQGVFGALAWSPWFVAQVPILKNLTLLAEYDNTQYETHEDEHPKGRSVSSKFNLGAALTIRDFVQIKSSYIRGEEASVMGSIFYNFGETKGVFPKKDDPSLYTSPVNFHPIDQLRDEKLFAKELAFAFKGQGFHVNGIWYGLSHDSQPTLWIKLINMTYWRNQDVKQRIAYLLSHLMPENIQKTIVIIEENGIAVEAYSYDSKFLKEFEKGKIDEFLLETVTSTVESPALPTKYEAKQIYLQRKNPWSITMRPRFITFLGSTTGKLKYSLGWLFSPEGYLFDSIYYKIQGAYNIISSLSDVGDMDLYNPSQLLNVRSDLVRYYKTQTVSLEQAYLQKGWNLGKGFYSRLALGYFEVEYAGLATELLYYPVNSNWAVGIEGATVLKRNYEGLGFQWKIRKLNGFTPEYEKYIGLQYFLDLYYDVKPLDIDVSVKIGQFLAKDKGAKFMLSRYFDSGMRFSLWYTLTTAHDIVNGCRYHDKGVAFTIPFDVFLPKSSRSMVGYAISAWLRDVGAVSETGKPLYPTLNNNRIY